MRDNIIANMNTPAPRLSPLFRSDTQAEILARVLLNPDRQYTIADLSRLAGATYATTHREVQRIIDMGLFAQRPVGRAVQVSANRSDPAYEPVVALLQLSYGPAVVVPRELGGVTGIDSAYIYGSWAARRVGQPGTPPGDIDVLVVGNPSRAAVAEAAGRAERVLGREVNIRIVSPLAWRSGADPFLNHVREQPLVTLDLEANR